MYSIHTIRITISYYLILECYTCCLLISCNDNSNTIILIASHINNNNNNNSNNKHHKKKTNIKHNNTNIYIASINKININIYSFKGSKGSEPGAGRSPGGFERVPAREGFGALGGSARRSLGRPKRGTLFKDKKPGKCSTKWKDVGILMEFHQENGGL